MPRIDDMAKTFDPGSEESRIYADWLAGGYFTPQIRPDREPFTIMIPPPNITGQLHMGHALDNTLQDILIRFKRMQGFSTLWLPGTDHAAIATEARIVAAMCEEGLTKADIGREAFLVRAWEWKKVYGGRIIEQLRRLGASCDWTRERFTMDEQLSEAVREVFVRLYEKGLIYRGERMINWCPHCRTTISDAEVEYEEMEGTFWYLRYPLRDDPLTDGGGDLVLATTRPETMLGDTAVAVHPDDERYKHLVGRQVVLPLMNRVIPIIADSYVDKEFGTGAVKITPAHDPNDFEIAQRHGLPVLNVLTDEAAINENGGRYAGLTREEARCRVVADLAAEGFLVRTEPHRHNVGTCYRCGTIVEPRVSLQWFVRMKPLAEPAIAAVRDGQTRFVPDRFAKIYFNWMENIRDWCISRQLWWGHRIPAWYCADCGQVAVAREKPARCSVCGGSLKQDEDTLDTWFSSALWPFSTLGWPRDTEDFRYFYPTSVLVTAYDIIFFWVARMIFSGIEHTGRVPFHTVFIHGIIRDAEGVKMSKSLGNGIDPLEIVDAYGADALRYALVTGTAPGSDQRFQQEKVEAGRNFINKIWNACRFAVMNFDDKMDWTGIGPSDFALEDQWILSRLQTLEGEVAANLDKYETGIALSKIYGFLWEEFCDWYIEISKSRLADPKHPGHTVAQYVLNRVLCESMKLLHPFMPFVTEAIYRHLVHQDGSIMVAAWPTPDPACRFPQQELAMSGLMEAVREIRNVRTSLGVPPAHKASLIVVAADEAVRQRFEEGAASLKRLAGIASLDVRVKATPASASASGHPPAVMAARTSDDEPGIPLTAVTAIFSGGELYLPLADLVDLDKETTRLELEKANLDHELERARNKLSNADFMSKAPAKVIAAEQAKLVRYDEMRRTAASRLDLLQKALQEQAGKSQPGVRKSKEEQTMEHKPSGQD